MKQIIEKIAAWSTLIQEYDRAVSNLSAARTRLSFVKDPNESNQLLEFCKQLGNQMEQIEGAIAVNDQTVDDLRDTILKTRAALSQYEQHKIELEESLHMYNAMEELNQFNSESDQESFDTQIKALQDVVEYMHNTAIKLVEE